MINRLAVVRGTLTEYPIAEKVHGGWQNGVTVYPDETVAEVGAEYVMPRRALEFIDQTVYANEDSRPDLKWTNAEVMELLGMIRGMIDGSPAVDVEIRRHDA